MPGFEEEGLSFKGPPTGEVGAPSKRQGGAALWARIDAIEVAEALVYSEQPVIRELDFGS